MIYLFQLKKEILRNTCVPEYRKWLFLSPQYCKMSALSTCLIEKFSILRTVGIYLSIHHKDCIEMENLKNLGDSFFQLHIISVDLKSSFNLS